MSVINLELVKQDLRVTHDSDNNLLQVLLNASEDEALRFLGRTELPTLPLEYPGYPCSSTEEPEEVPSSEDPLAASVYAAVFVLVKAKYEGATPDEMKGFRDVAENLLMPYRTGLGVL
jgi:hypothetical protein